MEIEDLFAEAIADRLLVDLAVAFDGGHEAIRIAVRSIVDTGRIRAVRGALGRVQRFPAANDVPVIADLIPSPGDAEGARRGGRITTEVRLGIAARSSEPSKTYPEGTRRTDKAVHRRKGRPSPIARESAFTTIPSFDPVTRLRSSSGVVNIDALV